MVPYLDQHSLVFGHGFRIVILTVALASQPCSSIADTARDWVPLTLTGPIG